MRILIVGLNYAPEIVGIAPYTTELAEFLVLSGHDVSVLTGFPYYPHWTISPSHKGKRPFIVERLNGVRVIRSPILLPGAGHSAVRRVLFDSSIAATSMLASVSVGRSDVVICVSPPLQLGVTAWIVARTRGANLILHLQDLVPDAAVAVGMMREGSVLDLARGLERSVYAMADQITVISQGFYSNLVRKGVDEGKLRVLPNWVDPGRFRRSRDSGLRTALGATNGETLVVHTGNMGGKQGLEAVLYAAALLAGERIAVTFVGDGNSRSELERSAIRMGLQNVHFAPLQKDYSATLAAADILLLTQRAGVVDSAAPSKLLSYMASGKPVVAAVNEMSEAGRMIREAKCGVVVPSERPEALAAALLEVHHRPWTHTRLGEAGRRHVSAHHERLMALEGWLQVIESSVRV